MSKKGQAASGTPVDDLEMENTEDAADKKEKKQEKETNEGVSFSASKLQLVLKLLNNIRDNNEQLLQLLSGMVNPEDEVRISIGQMEEGINMPASGDEDIPGGRVIEGVFDGENMIGPDGKQYTVPANYASKSKLVEGDILKLTITPSGTFVYKQIGPIERSRMIGNLEQASNGNFYVISGDKRWRVLTASVTYFKGKDGDEAVLLVPKAGDSKWAAVENVVTKPS